MPVESEANLHEYQSDLMEKAEQEMLKTIRILEIFICVAAILFRGRIILVGVGIHYLIHCFCLLTSVGGLILVIISFVKNKLSLIKWTMICVQINFFIGVYQRQDIINTAKLV